MAKQKEVRTFNINNLVTRAADDGSTNVIEGYASIFNSRTNIGDMFEEVIAPGAFAEAVSSQADVRALFNHNWDKVLGRTKSGTLRLSEDDHGLKFEVDLPDTTSGRDLAESLKRGDISQCSFGFIPVNETWDWDLETPLRTINSVELFEISVVSLPAYEDTEVALRSKQLNTNFEKRIKLIQKINTTLGGK